MKPAVLLFRTGIAFAITVGVFYTLCTLIWVLLPGPSMRFMNGLFHGMDFSSMLRPQPFARSGFLIALLVLSGWALLAGTFFAWLRNRMAD
jgi:2TM family of unknown function (DUF5676)